MAVAGTTPAEKPRDRVAFGALTAFAVVMYTIPSEWIPALAPLRLALTSSVLAAGLMLVRKLGSREPFFFDGLRGLSLILFGLIAFLSVNWSVAPEVTRGHSQEVLKLVAIYLTMVNVITTPARLIIFSGAMVLASIVTSWHVIDVYNSGIDLVEGYRARWLGVYADPNHMAMDIGLVVPIAVSFMLRKKNPWWMRLGAGVSAALAVTSIVYSHSRGGFIGLCAAMAMWIFLEKSRRLQSLVVAGLLFLCLLLFAPSSFWTRNETVADFEADASAMGRVYAWETAGEMSANNPLLGVGAGAFMYAWPLYAPLEAPTALVAHNVYLDVVGELGFIGLFFFLIFSGGASGAGFTATKSAEHAWLMNGISAAVTGYLVCNLFSGYTISAHLYVLFGLAACAERVVRLRSTEVVAEVFARQAWEV
ncbi:MAG: O-antigen ligase family protein [Myxococcaceae bacterium]